MILAYIQKLDVFLLTNSSCGQPNPALSSVKKHIQLKEKVHSEETKTEGTQTIPLYLSVWSNLTFPFGWSWRSTVSEGERTGEMLQSFYFINSNTTEF